MDSNDGQPSATCIKMPVGCNSADENSKQQKCHSGYLPLAQSKHEGLICALGWTFGPYSQRSLMSYTCLSPSVPFFFSSFLFFLSFLFPAVDTHISHDIGSAKTLFNLPVPSGLLAEPRMWLQASVSQAGSQLRAANTKVAWQVWYCLRKVYCPTWVCGGVLHLTRPLCVLLFGRHHTLLLEYGGSDLIWFDMIWLFFSPNDSDIE